MVCNWATYCRRPRLLVAALACLATACTRTPTVTAEEAARANERSFYVFLQTKRVPEATKFALYFEGVAAPSDFQRELLAQYYLQTCQPRKSLAAAEKISEPTRRDLFLAVNYTLLATPRPWTKALLKSQEITPPEDARVEKITGEIWRDEWSQLQTTVTACEDFPVLAEEETRSEYRQRALALFTPLVARDALGRDLTLWGLALDAGFPLSRERARDLLARFPTQKNHPYYKRIAYLSQTPGSPANGLRALEQKGSRVQLSTLSISAEEFVPHALELPLLPERTL